MSIHTYTRRYALFLTGVILSATGIAFITRAGLGTSPVSGLPFVLSLITSISMIRTKGEPGTGDIVQAVRHMRKMNSEIQKLTSMREDELFEAAKVLQVPYDLVQYIHDNGRLPVVNFAAGGVATPADAALMMQLGAEGVFVGSGIFKSGNPAKRAASIVKAVTNYTDARLIAELSADLGEAMVGINEQEIALLMAERGKD